MANKTDKDPLIKIINEMEKLRKHKVFDVLSSLDLGHYVFAKNYSKLLNLISSYEKDFSLWNLDKREKLDIVQREFLRLFNNYLAGMSSMFDHMRHIEKNLKNEKFSNFYTNKKEELAGGESGKCSSLMKGLRNYSQHYKLIPFFVEARYKDKKTKQSLLLKKEDLLKWSKWSKEDKEYINYLSDKCDSDNSIDAKTLINTYHQDMNVFYASLDDFIRKLYRKELNRAKFLDSKFRQFGSPVDVH